MTDLMPHTANPDSHLLPWSRHRTLPLPQTGYDLLPVKTVPHSHGPPTPPLSTFEMEGWPYPTQQRAHEISYPVRTHVPVVQPVAKSYKKALQITTEKYIKSSPPGISTLVQGEPEGRQSPSRNSVITTAFKLPSSIHAPQANLPQLAAEAACLFWFESSTTIRRIENWKPGTPVSADALCSNAVPSTAFRKWLATLLATTQVTPNVIILAILFIYKLKGFNQHIKGGPNSEFKLMTVALMLGNKFLDDNTYTNKTWAEVSAIPVKDVHIMEVEFLSNMRYSLYTSKAHWNAWHEKLGKIGTYVDLANKAREAAMARPMLLTPTDAQFPHALPSPPNAFPQLSPSYAGYYSPSYLQQSNTPVLLPQLTSSAISPMGQLPERDQQLSGRKRSFGEAVQAPPAKRRAPANYYEQQPTLLPQAPPQPLHPPVQQQLPNLPISMVNQMPSVQCGPQLPLPSSRSMSLVYQPPVSQHFQPQLSSQASMATNIAVSMPTSMASLQTSGLPLPPVLHPDHARQLSPYPGGSATQSPVNAMYNSYSGQVSQRHSPSYFLAQRSSPYRPVRHVQTLLAPPSSTPLYNAPRLVSHDQMQYHNLGRPYSERRVGHLPYLNHEAWPQHHQYNQWSEVAAPPAPDFHRQA